MYNLKQETKTEAVSFFVHFCLAVWLVQPGTEPGCLQWKYWDLTIGLLGNSQKTENLKQSSQTELQP